MFEKLFFFLKEKRKTLSMFEMLKWIEIIVFVIKMTRIRTFIMYYMCAGVCLAQLHGMRHSLSPNFY